MSTRNWRVNVPTSRDVFFDSSAGFRLPDGSILSPDAAYASAEALSRLPKGEL
jgi:hypothetical protein